MCVHGVSIYVCAYKQNWGFFEEIMVHPFFNEPILLFFCNLASFFYTFPDPTTVQNSRGGYINRSNFFPVFGRAKPILRFVGF